MTMNPNEGYLHIDAAQPACPHDECIPEIFSKTSANKNLEANTGRTPMQISEFSQLLICLGDPSKFRVVARLHPAPEGLIMTLERLFEKAVYSRRMNALLIKIQSTIITIYATGIVTMTRLNNADQAKELLNDVIGRINQSVNEGDLKSLRSQGEPRMHLDPMELTIHLPRTNCAKCGVKSCFYFATMLAYSEATLEKCQLLHEERYSANRVALEKLMSVPKGEMI